MSDRRTAELMAGFYGHLRDGLPKDEALRAAQLDLLRGGPDAATEDGTRRGVGKLAKGRPGDVTSPFYWAAFAAWTRASGKTL